MISGLILLVFLGIAKPAFSLQAIGVVGWPNEGLIPTSPSRLLGGDPVIGRLVCPALTRLHLKRGASEGLILGSVQNDGKRWMLALREGIHFWDGEKVGAEHLLDFVNTHLSAIASIKGAGTWRVPLFEAKATQESVEVLWKEAPSFGPFIFNDIPFWRKKPWQSYAYQCSGIYRPEGVFGAGKLVLTETPGYHLPGPEKLVFSDRHVAGLPAQRIEFLTADQYSNNPRERTPDRPISCDQTVDLPMMSGVLWNRQSTTLASPKMRALLTSAIPRGALWRNGTGFLGSLVSAPLPRIHPGYNHEMRIRPFDYAKVRAILVEKRGYRWDQSKGVLLTPKGEPLVVRLVPSATTHSLLDKIVYDSFVTVGIEVQWVKSDDPTWDGRISGWYLPWPEMNLLDDFHDHALTTLKLPSSESLNASLEAYAKSLTTFKPDFALLRNVHQELYKLEPISVALQHKACVKMIGFSGPGAIKRSPIDILDPDWFRALLPR